MCCVVGEVFSCVECNFISWGFTIDHGVTITGTLPPEVTGSYIIAGQQVATRRVDGLGAGVLYWLVGDHPSASLRIGLRSTTLVLDQNGAKVDEIRYYPYGAERWPLDRTFPTDYRFTGQKYEAGVGGLYQMGARWYDSELGRWISPDNIMILLLYLCMVKVHFHVTSTAHYGRM